MMGREAFQEVDYRHMFGPMAKWVEQIDGAGSDPRARVAGVPCRYGRQARALWCSRCPRTCSSSESDAADARPFTGSARRAVAGRVERVRSLLERAERPLAIVGGTPWSAEAHEALTAWLEAAAFRSPRAGGGRTSSTTVRRATRDTSRSVPTRV